MENHLNVKFDYNQELIFLNLGNQLIKRKSYFFLYKRIYFNTLCDKSNTFKLDDWLSKNSYNVDKSSIC